MNDFSERLDSLPPEKLALLAERLRARRAAPAAAARIPRRPAPGSPAALSFAQQRIWLLDSLAPGSAIYNVPVRMRLLGELDAPALTEALNEVVRRHESLRTTFEVVDGRPAQFVAPGLRVGLPVEDLRGLPDGEREAEAERLSLEEARCPFDLRTGPLLRARLLRLGDAEYLALLTIHHIVTDGWSMETLVREVAALYEAFTAGRPSPLAELPLQYADFALWQRQTLGGDVLAAQVDYWKRQLAGVPVLELPTDRPRPPVQTYRGATHWMRLPAGLVEALGELGRGEGATLFMTILAAFKVLLSRSTGQEDIAVGTPVAGRARAEVEGLIGVFINTLVVRTSLAGDPTFRQYLARVRRASSEALANQDVPFERLVEELQPARDLSHPPLFQVLFALQNVPREALLPSGLVMRTETADNGAAKFDLTLTVTEAVDGSLMVLGYNTDLFDAQTIERMGERLVRLLRAVVADPGRRLSELPLLSPEETRQLLVEFNDTAAPYPSDRCLHELFEEQAARTPDAPAVEFDGARLTYRELDERADRLARRLRALGVGPESLVGVLLERGAEMLVALLAVMKSGGAYVPLDPDYPRERLTFAVEDSRAAVLLTQESLRAHLPEAAARVVYLDADAPSFVAEERGDPRPQAAPDNAAYVIYTSGSTGRPKGVCVTHRALVNFMQAMREAPGLGPRDVLLAVTSLPFDIAALELYLPLLVGARVVVAGREVAGDGAALLRQLAACGANTMQATPTTWRMLVEAGWESGRGLKVLCGGEALPPRLAAEVCARAGRLWNMYGPTETTIWSTLRLIDSPQQRVTIGRPIANTRLYILDAHGRPSPFGVAGELYIGGDGLARGYLNRPALTAERFVPDPFSGEPGARLYRTGDVARYLADGEVEFLGRVDHQVKIRGHRIELGEVESALAAHDGVREVVVVARDDEQGAAARLVAYLTAADGRVPTAAELRGHLKRTLPDYMVPSAFVALDSLPLTPNGKVDRKALPDPGRPEASAAYAAPRTPTEELVAGLWGDLLNVGRVGAGDDFFALGGHSLLATQAVSRVREVFGVEVGLRALFEAPTVEGFAAEVERARAAGSTALWPPVTRAERGARLPLSFAQQRLWFLHQLEPESHVYNIPMSLRLGGTLNVAALGRTLAEIVRRHEVLRTSFETEGREAYQVISPETDFALPLTDLRGRPAPEREAEAARLAEEEARLPFDLTRAPLLRARLLRLDEEDHLLLLTMHHIASDGWSMGLLVGEVAALYRAFAGGGESTLPELPVQYADYAVWQRRHLTDEALAGHLEYWREHLRGAPLLELPSDRPRPSAPGFRGARLPVALPSGLSEQVTALSRREGVTPFMTLLSAFQFLLGHYSGLDDVVVGTDVANRNRAETEGLIGFFVNQLALRAKLDEGQSFRELLRAARETTLEAYARQDVPFEKVVEVVGPERRGSRAPLFSVKLVLQNTPVGDAGLELPGLTLNSFRAGSDALDYDLVLVLFETAGGIGGWVHYSVELFRAESAARLFRRYEALLGHFCAAPEATLGRAHALLSEADREDQTLQEAELREARLRKFQGLRRRSTSGV
ncbi:MAG TPA: amino acid adenylation domain-containing protein [Pyrinomonadaceae bacterium]|jgi:amino acid adenylation domain-containing protein